MRRRCALAVVLVVFALVGAFASPASAQVTPDEDAVDVHLDPGHVDEVTLVVEAEDGSEAERLVRERAAAADVPVHDVHATEPLFTASASTDGGPQIAQSHWEVGLTATLGESRGVLGSTLPAEQLRTLSGSESPAASVAVYRGTAVEGDGVTPTGGVVAPRYEVEEAGDLQYGVSIGRLGLLAGWLGASFALPYLLFRRRARGVERIDAPAPEKVTRLHERAVEGPGLVLLLGAAGVGLLLGARGATSVLAAAVVPVAPAGAWWDATLWFLAVAPFAAAVELGRVAAVQPTLSSLRDDGQSLGASLRAELRGQVLLGLQLWLALVVFAAVPAWSRTHPVTGGLLLGGLVLARALADPYLGRALGDVGPADPRIRAEVERLWRDAGLAPPTVRVVETDEATHANAALSGVVDAQRHLFVTDDLVERLSPTERRAVLAHERGHAANADAARRVGLAFAAGAVGFALAWPLPLPDLFVVPAVGVWYLSVRDRYALGQEYRADEHAAEATTPAAVVDSLERLAEVHGHGREASPDLQRATLHPSIADRVDRLDRLGASAPSADEHALGTGDD